MSDDIVRVNCVKDGCGTFVMDEALNRRYRETGDPFYCPAGHKQCYNNNSTESKLRKQIKDLKEDIEYYENQLHSLREHSDDLWDRWQSEKDLRKSLESNILSDVDGVIEITSGRYKWACKCGSKTTTSFDTEREAWKYYDNHIERMHEEQTVNQEGGYDV